MSQTGYLIPDWESNSIANGYVYGFINVGSMISRFQQMDKVTWPLKGNGGIQSTTGDMYKWYAALKSNTIISKSSFDKLTKPYLLEYEDATSHYGYGWVIYNSIRNTKIISHNGGNHIYFHDFIWLPEEDALVLLFTNSGSSEVEVAWPIYRMMFDVAFQVESIKKNLQLGVFEFIAEHSISDSEELITFLNKEYASSITDSHILNGLGYDINRYEDDQVHKSWALEIFKYNIDLFPENGNSWDSLGEAYLWNNEKEQAIKSYKRALELGKDKECSWCKSSLKALKKLGVK